MTNPTSGPSQIPSQDSRRRLLTARTGFTPLVIWLIGSVSIGLVIGLALTRTGVPQVNGLAGITAAILAGASATVWTWWSLRGATPAERAEIGWRRSKYPFFNTVLIVVTIFLFERLINLFYHLMKDLIGHGPVQRQPVVEALLEADGPFPLLYMGVATTIALPVFEEVIFRGHLHTFLVSRFGVALGIIAGSAIFAVLHFDPVHIPPLFLLGLSFAVVRQLTGSLLPAIFLHMCNNSLAMLALWVQSA